MHFRIAALVFTALALSAQSQFTTQQYALVIDALRTAFRGECVWLVAARTDASLHRGHALKVTHKALSDTHVAVTHVNATWPAASGEHFRCRRNRPLGVFLWERDAIAALTGHKVSSYPRWLLFKGTATASLNDLFNGIYIPFDCEFIVAELVFDTVLLTEVYRTHQDGVLQRGHFGTWSALGGATITKRYMYERRHSFEGLVLRGTAVDNRPSMSVTKLANGTLLFGGFFGEIWKILERKLNFTTVPVECEEDDFRYGKRLENGSWTGMIGMLQQGQVDVAVAGFQMLPERMRAADYLLPVVRSSMHMLLREPNNAEVDWADFLEPFSTGLWAAILFSVALLGVTLSGVRSVGRRHGNEEAESLDTGQVADSLLQVAGLFCQQGQNELPRALSSRGVFLLAGFTSIVYLASYSAELVSILTNQEFQLPFNSVAEFACDDTYLLGLVDNESTVHLIENSNNEGMRRLYDGYLQPQDNYRRVRNETSLPLLCTDKIAFLAIKPIVLEPLDCQLVWLPENLMTMSLSIMVVKGSPYRHILNKKLRIIWTSGVLRRVLFQWWPRQESAVNLRGALTQVTFGQTLPLLAVASAGLVLAVAVLVGEKAERAFSRRRFKRAARKVVARNQMRRIHVEPRIGYYN